MEGESLYLKKIVELVKRHGLSKMDVGDILEINRNTVHAYFTGKRSMKLEQLERLAEYLKIPVSSFFEEPKPDEAQTGDFEDPLIMQLLNEKDKRIEELKDQLKYLKHFYDQFSEEIYGTKRTKK